MKDAIFNPFMDSKVRFNEFMFHHILEVSNKLLHLPSFCENSIMNLM